MKRMAECFTYRWIAWTNRVIRTSVLALCSFLVSATVFICGASPSQSPLGFFTNTAARILQSEFQMDLNRIQVWPTNNYAPAVHRVFQVTANLYDSTTTNAYPTIFRPRFAVEGTTVFISGFEEVDSTNESFLTLPLDLSDPTTLSVIATNDRVNVYGIPWIIGAKKGFPNFNEVALNNTFSLTRRILVERPTRESSPSTFAYFQQLIVNSSNQIGIELWNSYRTNFSTPVEILVNCKLTTLLTNSLNLRLTNVWETSTIESISEWPGIGNRWVPPGSFVIPLQTNFAIIPDLAYSHTQNALVPSNNAQFEPLPYLPVNWAAFLKAQLRVVIRDTETKQILDYVHFDGPGMHRPLSQQIATSGTGFEGLWNTNLMSVTPFLPEGVMYQLAISRGSLFSAADWNEYGVNQPPPGPVRDKAIATFKAFYFGQRASHNGVVSDNPTNLVLQAPFTPTREVSQTILWQANDPLVHHLPSHLAPFGKNFFNVVHPPGAITNYIPGIGELNLRYEPWGGNPRIGITILPFDPRIKDPLVRSSDDWRFPNGEPLSFQTIGQIHRGTPWQTIFLKSENIVDSWHGLNLWMEWTSDENPKSALATAPTNDWRLIDLLAPLLNTNDVRTRLSVNSPDDSEWLTQLDGLTVLTNSIPEQELTISSNAPEASVIVQALHHTRASQPAGYFKNISEILATPELTLESPWLDHTPALDTSSDRALEMLPSQLLPWLRFDSVISGKITNNTVALSFTGYDGYPYAVDVAADLQHWISVSTNVPIDGIFEWFEPALIEPRFFRTRLLP